jgi:16S rRNA (guanine966-N2)-methyltransferase
MSKPKRRRAEPLTEATELKIVGGHFRGRKLRHEPFRDGDDLLVTRPMKHRLRETIFNLVGVEASGMHAIDLFAGTGALGLEALSRGASYATFIERHVPTARVVEENIAALAVEDRTTLLTTSAFLWAKRDLAKEEGGWRKADSNRDSAQVPPAAFPRPPSALLPWLVFCSPPYDFFVDRQAEMIELITAIMNAAPAASVVVVEADERFDFSLLPTGDVGRAWDVRPYAPAVVGVWRKLPSN